MRGMDITSLIGTWCPRLRVAGGLLQRPRWVGSTGQLGRCCRAEHPVHRAHGLRPIHLGGLPRNHRHRVVRAARPADRTTHNVAVILDCCHAGSGSAAQGGAPPNPHRRREPHRPAPPRRTVDRPATCGQQPRRGTAGGLRTVGARVRVHQSCGISTAWPARPRCAPSPPSPRRRGRRGRHHRCHRERHVPAAVRCCRRQHRYLPNVVSRRGELRRRRHPVSGVPRAQDFSFSYEIVRVG
jgi:hypothetical protein